MNSEVFLRLVTGPWDSGFARKSNRTKQMSSMQKWTKLLDQIETPFQVSEELNRVYYQFCVILLSSYLIINK